MQSKERHDRLTITLIITFILLSTSIGIERDIVVVKMIEHPKYETIRTSFADDDYIYTSCNDKKLRVWSRSDYSLLATSEEDYPNILTIFADDDYIYAAGYGKVIHVWEKDFFFSHYIAGLEGHTNAIRKVVADENYIYSASEDTTARVWSRTDFSLVSVLDDHTDYVFNVFVDDDYIYTGSEDKRMGVWSKTDFQSVMMATGHTAWVSRIGTDDDYIYSGSGDKTIRVWRKTDFSHVATLEGHTDWITSLVVEGPYIYSSSADGTVRIWNRADFSLEKVLDGQGMFLGVLHVVGDYLFIRGADRNLRILKWVDAEPPAAPLSNPPSGEEYTLFTSLYIGRGYSVLDVHVDEDYVYTCSDDKNARVWSKKDFSLLKVLEGHTSNVDGIFADEDYIYTASNDKTARVWDRSDFSLVTTLLGHSGVVSSVYADKDYIYTASADDTARIWSRSNFSSIATLQGHSEDITGIFADPYYIFTTSYDDTMRVWSRSDFSPVGVLRSDPYNKVNMYSVSADDDRIYAAAGDGPYVWSKALLSPIEVPDTRGYWDVLVDEKYLYVLEYAIGIRNRTDMSKLTVLNDKRVDGENSVFADEEYVYAAAGGKTAVWKRGVEPPYPSPSPDPELTQSFVRVSNLNHNLDSLYGVHADSDYIYTAAKSGSAHVWDRVTFSNVKYLSGHTAPVRSVYADQDYVYTASVDRTVRVLDRSDFSLVGTLEGHTGGVTSVVADSDRIYSASQDTTARVWSRSDRSLVASLEGHTDWVYSIFVDDEHIYTASGDHTVRVWSKADLTFVGALEGHTDTVYSVFADDEYIYSASFDRTAKVWSKTDRSLVRTLDGHTNWVWSVTADDNFIYTSDDSAIYIWKKEDFSLVNVSVQYIGRSLFTDEEFIYGASNSGIVGLFKWNSCTLPPDPPEGSTRVAPEAEPDDGFFIWESFEETVSASRYTLHIQSAKDQDSGEYPDYDRDDVPGNDNLAHYALQALSGKGNRYHKLGFGFDNTFPLLVLGNDAQLYDIDVLKSKDVSVTLIGNADKKVLYKGKTSEFDGHRITLNDVASGSNTAFIEITDPEGNTHLFSPNYDEVHKSTPVPQIKTITNLTLTVLPDCWNSLSTAEVWIGHGEHIPTFRVGDTWKNPLGEDTDWTIRTIACSKWGRLVGDGIEGETLESLDLDDCGTRCVLVFEAPPGTPVPTPVPTPEPTPEPSPSASPSASPTSNPSPSVTTTPTPDAGECSDSDPCHGGWICVDGACSTDQCMDGYTLCNDVCYETAGICCEGTSWWYGENRCCSSSDCTDPSTLCSDHACVPLECTSCQMATNHVCEERNTGGMCCENTWIAGAACCVDTDCNTGQTCKSNQCTSQVCDDSWAPCGDTCYMLTAGVCCQGTWFVGGECCDDSLCPSGTSCNMTTGICALFSCAPCQEAIGHACISRTDGICCSGSWYEDCACCTDEDCQGGQYCFMSTHKCVEISTPQLGNETGPFVTPVEAPVPQPSPTVLIEPPLAPSPGPTPAANATTVPSPTVPTAPEMTSTGTATPADTAATVPPSSPSSAAPSSSVTMTPTPQAAKAHVDEDARKLYQNMEFRTEANKIMDLGYRLRGKIRVYESLGNGAM